LYFIDKNYMNYFYPIIYSLMDWSFINYNNNVINLKYNIIIKQFDIII